MLDKHSELEKKFAADHVTEARFNDWAIKNLPFEYRLTGYPDIYYRNANGVVRHRLKGGAGELTVKQRKSMSDITDRREIDLTFAPGVTSEDVEAFLTSSGWKKDLTLVKNFAHVYAFKSRAATVTIALYEVRLEDGSAAQRFLEVEVEKDSDVTPAQALVILELWSTAVEAFFDLAVSLRESLYEIYSGKRYSLAQ